MFVFGDWDKNESGISSGAMGVLKHKWKVCACVGHEIIERFVISTWAKRSKGRNDEATQLPTLSHSRPHKWKESRGRIKDGGDFIRYSLSCRPADAVLSIASTATVLSQKPKWWWWWWRMDWSLAWAMSEWVSDAPIRGGTHRARLG